MAGLLKRLDHRSVIDVGAERGGLAEELLRAGAEELHVFEPHPDNVKALRRRFDTEAPVAVHELAVGESDGSGELHVSVAPSGVRLPFGHTLLDRTDTDEIGWGETITVNLRSLGSMVDADELPRRVGILKIDTEGHDFAVVRGMGSLEADVVMVEHWTDLPHGLGQCPWTTQDMLAELQPRGFTRFAFVVHRGEFITLKWDDGEVERGAMGNLVFLHDGVLARLLPDVIDCAGWLAERAVRVGQMYMDAARDRLALVSDLEEAAEARGQALEATTERLKDLSAELESLRAQSH